MFRIMTTKYIGTISTVTCCMPYPCTIIISLCKRDVFEQVGRLTSLVMNRS